MIFERFLCVTALLNVESIRLGVVLDLDWCERELFSGSCDKILILDRVPYLIAASRLLNVSIDRVRDVEEVGIVTPLARLVTKTNLGIDGVDVCLTTIDFH